MFARPKAEETEEDILNLQAEFLKYKQSTSSATVFNKRKSEGNESVSGETQDTSNKKPRSKFASTKANASGDKDEARNVVGPDVLGEIKEKNMSHVFVPPPRTTTHQGFPEPFVRDKTLIAKGRSIFSQQVTKFKTNEEEREMEVDATETSEQVDNENVNQQFGDKSFVLTGQDAPTIHKENIEKLSKLSAEEIRNEQQKLASQLDPKLLQFIRSRRKEGNHIAKQLSNFPSSNSGDSNSSKMETSSSQGGVLESQPPVAKDTKTSHDSDLDVSELEGSDTQSSGVENVMADLDGRSVEANKWLHMDIVEREKLQWIGEIPPAPSIPADKPYAARFDFQGALLPYADDSVNVTQALHHHGDEPERPGYALQELLQLSRSSVLQQRVLALTTLANILDKAKAGYYDDCMESPLLNQLIDSDLYLLFRFSLDDNSETIVTATLLALRNLLWSHPDELCLDRLLGLWDSHRQPSLMVKSETTKPNEKAEQQDEESELKDHQILRLDMVKGALRTDLILRLRYILEVLRPGPQAVINVLEILMRIVRHSQDSALAVTCCPRLLSTIVTNFVPRDWGGIVGSSKPSEMETVFGVPLVEGLKLLRVIASCSRSMASDLVHKFGVMTSIVGYISIDPRECGLPQQEAIRLSLESLYLWNTLLAYNLATTHFTDLYSVLMRLLQFHLSATSVGDSGATFGHEHGAAVMSLLKEALLAADSQMKRSASQRVANIAQRIPVTLTYEQLSGFSQLLQLCLKKWLSQLVRAEEITFSALKLVSATLNCSAVHYTKLYGQAGMDSVLILDEINDLVTSTVEPLLSSSNFKLMCSRIKSSSSFLSSKRSGKDRDPSSLPSLGALMWGGREVVPSINLSSPLAFFQALSHFLASVCSIHRGIHSKCLHHFFEDANVLDYVNQLGSEKLHATDNWFTRIETTMLVHMLKLLKTVLPATDFRHVGLFHNLALRLVSVIPSGEKFLAKEIFSQAVFNSDFFRDCCDVSYSLEALKLSDVAPQKEQFSICTLLEKATSKITDLWNCYQTSLQLGAVTEPCPLDITTLTAGENGLVPAFPNDWTYLPILKLYNKAISGQADASDNKNSIVSSLQWLLIVECFRPQAMATISVTARFCRLSTVFLAGSDLFLEPDVHHHLDALLRILLRSHSLLDFNEKIPGLTSFYDLYTQLVEQFAAVSYGDELFGHFILIPLQQRHSPSYRKLVWSEHAAILRVLRTPVKQLAVPIQSYLTPSETEPSLLMAYLRGVATGQIRESWCPVLYRVAIHHVAVFISDQPDTSIAQQLVSKIRQLRDKQLQDVYLNYTCDD